MITLVVGLVLVALGIGGIRYAPAIVAAQRRQGMTPLESDEHGTLEEADRIQVTKGTGVVLVLGGFAVLVYGSGIF